MSTERFKFRTRKKNEKGEFSLRTKIFEILDLFGGGGGVKSIFVGVSKHFDRK